MSKFKMVIIGVFSVCSVVAVVIFALSKGPSGSSSNANLLVWGTISTDDFSTAYTNSSIRQNKNIVVTYVQKHLETFDADFVEAIASGSGPDVVLLRDDSIFKNSNKLLVIPYTSYPQRSFKDLYIEEGEMFLSADGVIAVPFIVDPMVMYWNRDLFSNNLVSQPPKYWDEFGPLVDKLTKRDSSGNILQSSVAMGEWKNITNAKEVVSMLLMQAGTPISSHDAVSDKMVSVLNSTLGYPVAPSQSAINFYTQFSNPSSPNYTWNRSLPSSSNFFLSGNLATYLGFASEIFSIQQKNSNLNFDVTTVPQIRNTTKKIVFAHMYAFSIVKRSAQVSPAFLLITSMTEAPALTALEAVTNLPPVRRDLLAVKQKDAFRTVFYNSAILSHSWIDPNSTETSNIFRDMIESITSGRARLTEALDLANNRLDGLFK